MISKYFLTALLSIILLFTSLPVYAAEISGNDANNGIMLLSANDGIATTGTYYPNSILNDTIQKSVKLSYFTDIINLDFKLCDIYFNGDSDFYSRCNLLDLYFPCTVNIYDTDSIEVPPSIVNYKLYVNINGKKYYFLNQWESIVPDDYIFSAVGHFGIELQLNNKDNEFFQFFNLNITGDATKNTYYTDRYDYDLSGNFGATSLTKSPVPIDITVSWTNVEWDIKRESNTVSGIITSIYNKLSELFNQMDQDQEEIINGFDPSTGNTADSEFNDGADELHNVENSLFQSAAYDEVDYSQYNDFFSLTGVAGAISFVASFFESLYSSLGIYAVPFTIGLVLIIITRILGYQNFSAGGG